jgi:DNA-binding winged helix-turn-helix (wHTH) protein/heme-degrading monooxygenase HmoA
VFRGRVRPGRGEEFARYVRERAVPAFRAMPGMLEVRLGSPSERNPDEFMVETHWADLAALRRYAGDRWWQARIAPREAALLVEVSVHHYVDHDDGAEETVPDQRDRSSPENWVIDLGPLQIDLVRGIALVEDRTVEVPPREFAVLAELATHPREPLSSELLCRLAWPNGSWSGPEDVRRSVYRLRRLLGDHERARPWIRNRRGYGYLLDPPPAPAPRGAPAPSTGEAATGRRR